MMPKRERTSQGARPSRDRACTDPVVGAILSGWRYDISAISPEMRTDYEQHLFECGHCKHRQRAARTIDVLLLLVSTLSILAFLLAAVVIRRIEFLSHMEFLTHIDSVQHMHLRQMVVTISLEAAAIAGLVFSTILWILVAIATPLPGFLTGVLQERLPSDLRQRFSRHASNRA